MLTFLQTQQSILKLSYTFNIFVLNVFDAVDQLAHEDYAEILPVDL